MSGTALAERPLSAWLARRPPDGHGRRGKAGEQTDHFDIYLPKWIAGHNRLMFGLLFLFGEAVVLWRWLV